MTQVNTYVSNFLKDKKGFYPNAGAEWTIGVDEAHELFSESIMNNEKSISKKITLNRESCDKINSSDIPDNLLLYLAKIEYFSSQWPEEECLLDMLCYKYKQRKGRQVKISRDILKHVNKRSSLESSNKKYITKLVSELGDKFTSSSSSFFVSMSVSPEAFITIGHYDVDEHSCFRQRGECNSHKFKLGLHQDVFVMTISKEEINFNSNKTETIGRAWGWKTEDGDFCLTNFYLSGINKTTANELFKQFFEEHIVNTAVNIKNKIDTNAEGLVYLNGDAVLFSLAEEATIRERFLDLKGICVAKCSKCGDKIYGRIYKEAHEDRVCADCYHNDDWD